MKEKEHVSEESEIKGVDQEVMKSKHPRNLLFRVHLKYSDLVKNLPCATDSLKKIGFPLKSSTFPESSNTTYG